MIDQVYSFWRYFIEVKKINKSIKADLVFASSSRLFTAFLGYTLAKKSNAPLYLDIRDIFVDTMSDVFKSVVLKSCLMPILRLIEIRTFNYAIHINLISGGFKNYFDKFRNSKFTFFTNGIDEEFLQNSNQKSQRKIIKKRKKTIVYAGNIGEGQGLHKIIPKVAKVLSNDFEFLIIGDGGTKIALQQEIIRNQLTNVILKNPIKRLDLHQVYQDADFLFLHLNDFPAFRKVLPSKIFELATFDKPILAGVSGYAAEFLRQEVLGVFVFDPCDVERLVDHLRNFTEKPLVNRQDFLNKFRRSKINVDMASSILGYI